jgi:hypothetical protein
MQYGDVVTDDDMRVKMACADIDHPMNFFESFTAAGLRALTRACRFVIRRALID